MWAGRGRDPAVTRFGAAGPALWRRPDPRVETRQVGRTGAGRQGVGRNTEARESGVRVGRDEEGRGGAER